MIAQVIREWIGFDGALMSDDLSMQALSGTPGERAGAALVAGCDLVLHCNGDLGEMQAVAQEAPELAGASARRTDAALASRRVASDFDIAAARAEFTRLMAVVGVEVATT